MPAATTETVEVVPADPRLRRILLLTLLAVSVFALAAAWWVPPAFRALLALARESPGQARARGVAVMLLLVSPFTLLGLVAGVDTLRRSVRTVRAERFPPPGARVVRTTRVVRGGPARALGTFTFAIGGLLVILSTILPWFAYRAGVAFERGCARAMNTPIQPACLTDSDGFVSGDCPAAPR